MLIQARCVKLSYKVTSWALSLLVFHDDLTGNGQTCLKKIKINFCQKNASLLKVKSFAEKC